MIVSSLGVIDDAIEVPDGTTVFDHFRVKVMVGEPGKSGECIAVEDFPVFPDDGQIIWAVSKHNGSYAEVVKILEPDTLPFSDAGCCSNCPGDCNNCDTARELDAAEMAAYETEDDLPC